MRSRWSPIALTLCLMLSGTADGMDVSGYVGFEPRYFLDEPLFPEQPDAGLSPSAVAAPELRYEWGEGDDRLTLAPFFRWDDDDSSRTHWDLREALWLGVRGPWTWRVGVGQVFWGVTESRHLVDVVNQTDLVEDVDEEEKLGQPMVALTRWTASAGTFELFLLPGFRERTFPAGDARLRGPLPIDTDRTEYESGAGKRRLDWAVRWSRSTGGWDIGLSGFNGTSRDPHLLPRPSTDRLVLVPRYNVIQQLGLELQYTRNAWLWKLETIVREGDGHTFGAAVGGFEYTLFDLAGSGADLGLLAEYLYDGRDASAPPTIYDDDVFLGVRLGLNDVQGTAMLLGAVIGDGGTIVFLDGERRLGDVWKVEVEARLFADVDRTDPWLAGFRDDSFLTLRIARYL